MASAALDITFPGNLAQVPTAAMLRLVPLATLLDDDAYLVSDIGLFVFDPSSLADDDGVAVIRPAGVTPLQAGRWVLSGLAAGLATLAVADGATKIGFGARTVSAKLQDTASVKDFAAKGDGATNDTSAILAGDNAARLLGKDLFFPAGTYMIDAETRATTNWRGEAGTIIKYRGQAASFVRLVYASGVDGITFEGLTFDGSVSADPGAWTVSNYDSFTGASGLSVESCNRPRIVRCRFANTRQHGLRVVGCMGPFISGCTSKRSRGAFGDGFYLVSNIGLSISSCWADDYTRIGFVVDSNGDNVLTNHKIGLSSLLATNGHDASIMYGGGEFNAGIWCEHTGDVEATGCFTANNTHRGINVCTGSKSNGFPGNYAMITLNNCQTVGGNYGIYTYSLGALPVIMKATGCTAKLALTAFEADANNKDDAFAWIGCHADYDASSGTARGFAVQPIGALTAKPLFEVIDCTVSRWAETLSNLDDSGDQAATADIGPYGITNGVQTAMRLVVRNLKHVDSAKPVYVRWYGSFAHEVDIAGCDLFVRRGAFNSGFMMLRDNVVRAAALNYGAYAETVKIHDNQIRGRITVMGSNVRFNNNDVRHVDDSNVAILCDAANKRPAVTVSGNTWSKAVNMYGPALQFGNGSQSFGAVVGEDVVYNAGVPSPSLPFLARASGVTVFFSGTLIDDTIVNSVAINDTQASPEVLPTGVRKVLMH